MSAHTHKATKGLFVELKIIKRLYYPDWLRMFLWATQSMDRRLKQHIFFTDSNTCRSGVCSLTATENNWANQSFLLRIGTSTFCVVVIRLTEITTLQSVYSSQYQKTIALTIVTADTSVTTESKVNPPPKQKTAHLKWLKWQFGLIIWLSCTCMPNNADCSAYLCSTKSCLKRITAKPKWLHPTTPTHILI